MVCSDAGHPQPNNVEIFPTDPEEQHLLKDCPLGSFQFPDVAGGEGLYHSTSALYLPNRGPAGNFVLQDQYVGIAGEMRREPMFLFDLKIR